MLRRKELLGEPVTNATAYPDRQGMNGGREPITLAQNLGVLGALHEQLDVHARPPMDALIVISGNEHTLGVLRQDVHHPPLQGGQVLRLIDNQELGPRTLVHGADELVDHVHKGDLVVDALVQGQFFLDLTQHGPRHGPIRSLCKLLLEGDAAHDGPLDKVDVLVPANGWRNDQPVLRRSVVGPHDVDPKAFTEVFPLGLCHNVRPAHTQERHPKGVKRPEVGQVLGCQAKGGTGTGDHLFDSLAREGYDDDPIRTRPLLQLLPNLFDQPVRLSASGWP